MDLKILTLILACFGAYIAFQQYRINHQKLKLDLFERRYAVFDAVKQLIHQVISEASVDNRHINEFKINTADAKFLFKDDVINYLQEILNKSIELKMYQTKLRAMPDENERSEIIDKEHNVILWFTEELNCFQNSFMPYMGMRE
jgi:flagellar biosynthesis GTPase FlhF